MNYLKKSFCINNILQKWRVKTNFKKNDIKNHACYYFDYIMRVIDINSRDNLLDKKNTKIF